MLAVSKSAQRGIYVAWKLNLHANLIRILKLRGSLKNLLCETLNFTVKWGFPDIPSHEMTCDIFNWNSHHYSDTYTIDYCSFFFNELHLLGLEMATPSSSACGRVNPAQTPVLSAPTWRALFPASSWKRDMRTFCSTSCPLTPAVWLTSLTCWPTTTRS